jgi:signal transduction histidine kinase
MTTGQDASLDFKCLAHDLNNVFTTINEAAEVLASDPRWAAISAALHRSVDRGKRLVDGFCETAGGATELNLLLDSAIDATRDYLELVHGPRVEFRRDVDSGVLLHGIPASWERVFVNLFINAAEVMPSGGLVEIVATREPGRVSIRVRDDGPGIAPELLSSIFDRDVSSKGQRRGLGLHIVRTIVERNGGEVTAARAQAGGAEFSMTLPA